MRLPQSVLRPTNKVRLRLDPGCGCNRKDLSFPAVYIIKLPVKPVISKSVRMAHLAAVYFAAGKLGLLLAHVHASVSPVWPATGMALAALLLWGIDLWPAVFVGRVAGEPGGGARMRPCGIRDSAGLGIAGGNTLEAVAGAWLVSRFANGCKAFLRANDVFRYTFLAGSLGHGHQRHDWHVDSAVLRSSGREVLALPG